ncbi:8-oxo-dGTP diphosphatase MutT [Bartonella sp. DGB2]|uniref:8-oxo-dGTP diphosphatase MutT n=1 Tax=Bartonella sp. DGB2 TaxID=3388426 RepID=UPI0039903337
MVAEKPLLLVVACALLDTQGRVLLNQRPEGKSLAGLWEFPGGKVEAGETPEMALVRELVEELGIEVAASDLIPLSFTSHAYSNFHLLMPLYVCHRYEGALHGLEGQAIQWVAWDALETYPMPPADLPLLPLLQAFCMRHKRDEG